MAFSIPKNTFIVIAAKCPIQRTLESDVDIRTSNSSETDRE